MPPKIVKTYFVATIKVIANKYRVELSLLSSAMQNMHIWAGTNRAVISKTKQGRDRKTLILIVDFGNLNQMCNLD